MRAVVLVGGEGTRLRPLTYAVPKQMLPVAGVPMIERVVGHLVSHGITDVILSLGYRPDAFLAAYPDSRCAGATLTYVVEKELLDTGGAVRFAATKSGIDEQFLVVNGDVLTDLDLTALIAFHGRSGAEGTIALTPVADPSPFGVVPTDEAGRVTAFIEKPPPGTAPTNMINAGFYVLEPSVLDRIADDRRVHIEDETFPAMVADGALFALGSDAYWLDVGTPQRYLDATADLLAGRRPGPPVAVVAPGALVEGKVTGSLVADGARVGASAIVDGSVISAGAVVGCGASICRSVVLSTAVIGDGAQISDSIVGWGATVGAGAALQAWTVIGENDTVPAASGG